MTNTCSDDTRRAAYPWGRGFGKRPLRRPPPASHLRVRLGSIPELAGILAAALTFILEGKGAVK